MRTSNGRARAGWMALASVLSSVPLQGQSVYGVVSDSALRTPIAGVVVQLLDSTGASLARTITDQSGAYRLPMLHVGRRVRALRIGFRPSERPVRRDASGSATVDLRLMPVPTLLESVGVRERERCPARPGRAESVALFEQAQSALLATDVARESRPASMTVLKFDRELSDNDTIVRQSVWIDAAPKAATSFAAAADAADLTLTGFVREHDGTRTFYGPDAAVLLNPAFTRTYCLHLQTPPYNRAGQLGLAFAAAERSRGRIDIEGTLWVDTVARELRDIEFRYVGLERMSDPVRPGGVIVFRQMDNGVLFIHRWAMRLPATAVDTTFNPRGEVVERRRLFARESGGEVATAEWSDGTMFTQPLGAATIQVSDTAGRPVRLATIRLVNTDYVATTDSAGRAFFGQLLPGPYRSSIATVETQPLSIAMPTTLRIVAKRDHTVSASINAPEAARYVRRACLTQQADGERVIEAVVHRADGTRAARAHWELTRLSGSNIDGATEQGLADASGRFIPCLLLNTGDHAVLRAWLRRGARPESNEVRIRRETLRIDITLPLP